MGNRDHSPKSPVIFESRLSAGLGKIQAGGIYLAAVSGGADSTAMLAGLAGLRKEAGFVLHCIHVEHGIRPPEESRGDAAAVKSLCEKLEVPCRIVFIAPGRIAAFAANGGPGIEGAARFFRIRALRREARRVGAAYILTGHTRDDLLETLLMRILRGSGPAGLSAMPRLKRRMLRPLLDLTRQDVLAYLETQRIPYRTDSTNVDIRFLRNRVRFKLVPLLDEFFPSWRGSLLALAETQSMAAEFLTSEARKTLPWEKGVETPVLRLREADFSSAAPILREEAIFAGADILAALRSHAYVPVPKRSTVRSAARQAAASADLGPLRLGRRDGFIELTPKLRPCGERGFSLVIKEEGLYTIRGRGQVLGFNKKKTTLSVRAGLAPDGGNTAAGSVGFYAGFPLVLRNYQAVDRIYRGGHKRRFSDILNNSVRAGTEIISAEDAEGIAAFICFKGSEELLVISREFAGSGNYSLFEVFGVTNAG